MNDPILILGLIAVASSIGFFLGALVGSAGRERHWQEQMRRLERNTRRQW